MKNCILFLNGVLFLSCLKFGDAGWKYNDVKTLEGDFPGEEELTSIQSDNMATTSYAMSSDGPDKFRIDSKTGTIYKIAPLDRETKDRYTITAKAYDSNGVPTEEEVTFEVIVLDANDNSPVFVEQSLLGTLSEDSPRGPASEPFMYVRATDADDPDTNYNADVVYKVEDGSDAPASTTNRFTINEEGGVRLLGDLDYETNPRVTFNVIALDRGGRAAALATTSIVTVKVLDANDHAPNFRPLQPKSLVETSPLKKPLYDMTANDVDEGVNGKVYFDIIEGNTGGAFEIVSTPSETEENLGQLQLVKELDYESGVVSYDLKIKAYNKDALNYADERFASIQTLKITVVDVNEAPIFRNTPYSSTVDEGPAPTEPIPLPGVFILAEDVDFNGNQTVTYSIDDPEGWFQINPQTGVVTHVGAVDRENPVVENGVYHLKVQAHDNYDNGPPATRNVFVDVTIKDLNDNPPSPKGGVDGTSAFVCEEPKNSTVTVIEATDPDSPENGPDFIFRFDSSVDSSKWAFKKIDGVSQEVIAKFSDYGLDSVEETVELKYTITDSGTIAQTGTATLTVKICKCDSEGNEACQAPLAGGFPFAIVIGVIALILLIVIAIFALVTYRRRQAAMVLKEPFFDDEDDVRETVQVYQEECGEEDQDAYDLSALRAPLMEDPSQPVRKEVPVSQAPRRPRTSPPDDIVNIIGEAKDVADGDPTAPPFDSLLVFDYEGTGSDAGSLSSINTATTDGSMDYDYLNDWGPRFKKLADMYNDGSESE